MTYQIADEPVESSLTSYVVSPSMPLLAIMLAGAWLAWPWYAFNAIALGSPTRRREIALCIAGFAGTAALGALALFAIDRGWITTNLWARLCGLAIAVYKIAITYAIAALQNRTFHVYRYYGGGVREARRVLIAGTIIRGTVLGLVDSNLWRIIMSGGI